MENLSIKDKLEMSKKLWEKHSDYWEPLTPEHGRDSILYMIEEVGEVISLLKKKGEDEIMNNQEVRNRFVEEMTDVMMYFTDTLNRFGVTAEEFSTIYYQKYETNMNRNFRKDHNES
jgi:NTP pyrophosphatase (non-canonical NTP hydrolase)